jgi:hypothetical protein
VVDAIPASPARTSIPGTEFEAMRERLHNALLKPELREQDVARFEQRNAYLEGELKLQGQHHTNALKKSSPSGGNWRRSRQSGDNWQ